MNEHADPTKMFEQLLGRDLSSLDEEERHVLASFVARRPISLDAGEESENRATFYDGPTNLILGGPLRLAKT